MTVNSIIPRLDYTKREAIFFFLALLLMNVRVNLVGSISITELYVLLIAPKLWKWSTEVYFPLLRYIRNLLILLIGVQIVSSVVLGTPFLDVMKSLMLTIETLLLILFFVKKMLVCPKLVVFIPLAQMVSLLVFGDQFGYMNDGEITYFKFYIAPLVSAACCIASLQTKFPWFNKNSSMVFAYGGLFCIIGGARSVGFTLLFTAVLSFILGKKKNFSLKKYIPHFVAAAVLCQLLYAFVYVPKVVSGEWGSTQNREQLATIDNSRNICMMLFAARTDFFVSWIAFQEKPLFGHGYMAEDTTGKYRILQAKLLNKEYKDSNELAYVPAHSVLLGYGIYHGVLALIIFGMIFYSVYKNGISSIVTTTWTRAYLIFAMIASSQHILFGPPAVLKNNNSMLWAFILVAFYYSKYYKNEIQTARRNSNLPV